jgi:hypothetical protein
VVDIRGSREDGRDEVVIDTSVGLEMRRFPFAVLKRIIDQMLDSCSSGGVYYILALFFLCHECFPDYNRM